MCPAWADKHTNTMRSKSYKALHIATCRPVPPSLQLHCPFSLGYPQSTKREGKKRRTREHTEHPVWFSHSISHSCCFHSIYHSFLPILCVCVCALRALSSAFPAIGSRSFIYPRFMTIVPFTDNHSGKSLSSIPNLFFLYFEAFI